MRRMRSLRSPGAGALALVLLGASLALALAGQAGAAAVTGSGDDLRTGWYPESSSISPQLVSGGSFGQMWSTGVEGSVYGQPLLADGTLLVATEKNQVYGLDPSTGARKWSKSLGTPWNPADIGCADLTPTIGVTSTPVIDTATGVAYMTHKTYASGTSGPARWYMDAIGLADGAEQPGFPVELAGTAQNAARTFSPTTQLQRPGLLLMGGVVYAAFGAHCDVKPWQGWIFGVSTAAKVTARYVANTTKEGAGIWQSGSGLTSDGAGTILFTTGNGGAPSQPAAGNTPPANLGESVVRLRVQGDGSLKAVDFFAPFNGPTLDESDADFASGGVTGLPSEYFGTAALPHLAVADGKQGYVYLLNRDSLGGVSQGPGGSDNVIQRLGPRGGVWSRPGVWPGDGGYVYIPTSSGTSAGGNLDVYKYGVSGTGMPSLSLAASSSDAFGWGSGAPVITSDGTTSGSALVWIVWSANRSGSGGQLRAYDPVPVSGKPVMRFSAPIGTASNYSVPGVGAGKLFVGTREGKVLAFGAPVSPPLTGPALSFPTTTIGKTTEKTLTLTASESLTVTKLDSSSSQFQLGASSPALPATLAAGQKISLPVKFAPAQSGLIGGTVTATLSDKREVPFAVSGTGQTEAAQLVLLPPVLSFQATAIGGHRAETATFSNGGGQPLTITEVELPQSPFSAEGAPKAGEQIAPGASITVTVHFDPTKAGTFGDAIGLRTSAGEGQIALSGTAGAPGTLQIASEATDFGSVLLGTTLTKSFTVTNVGGTAVPITKSKPPLGGEFVAASSLQEGTTIQAGESVTEQVTFAPTEVGLATGDWLITGEDTSGPHDVLLSGSGTTAAGSPPSQAASAPTAQGVSGVRAGATPRGPLATLARTALAESRRGTVALRVSCPAWERSCLGTVVLKAAMPTHGARRSSAPRSVVLTLATGSFVLSGGRTRTLTLHLSARARARLARVHLLKATATIAARDPAGLTHTARVAVTIRSAAAARRTGA
ncbi:MAG TPA: choice-of-anchor D domain-containing protein [Solirubrobacteraceae bacterium]|nr:choice-of-anchor D domain-containing protein [Solirubrobacteraceae bacterium]